MTDVEKKILEFRRQFKDERDERFRRVLAILEGQEDKKSGVEADLSGYVPKFRDATGWALDSLPEELWFASNAERVFLALESMENLPYFSEIPEEYLAWARTTDWSNPEVWMQEGIENSSSEKFRNFLAILMPFFQAHFADIPDTIENVIANQSPTDGDIWYAAMMVQSMAELMQWHDRLQDEILSGDIPQDFDLEEKVSKATQAAFAIGWLYRDRWWLNQHGGAAARYYEKIASLREAQVKGSTRTKEKYSQLKKDCLGYYQKAFDERKFAFVAAPLPIMAETIRELAMRERPSDFVGPNGDPLSLKWFRETLEDFQADGRHAWAIEKVLRT